MATQPLIRTIVQAYGYWDGTNTLTAIPVKTTANSQAADWVVFAQDGTSSLKTNVRHQSSGDANYWVAEVTTATVAPPPPR